MSALPALLLLAVPAAAQEEVPGESVGGLRWTVRLRPVLSTRDPLPVEWKLLNASGGDAVAVFDDAVQPRVELTLEGKPWTAFAESRVHGISVRHGTIHPGAGGDVRGVEVRDLRLVVGRLAAGRYGLRVVWPIGGVRLQGMPPAEQRSALVEFDVREAGLREAEAGNVRDPRAEIVPRAPVAGKDGGAWPRKADLVNRSDRTLLVSASRVTDYVRTWDVPRLGWASWVPGVGWRRPEGAPWAFCASSRTTIALRPGASLEIDLPPTGDGLHRFEAEAWPEGAPGERFDLRSTAIEVDTLEAARARLLRESR